MPSSPSSNPSSSALLRALSGESSLALLLAAVALVAFVYYPITHNFFHADDFLNLYRIANKSLPDYLLSPHGGHLLVTRNAIFYLLARAFGPEPSYFLWSAFATHLLNVALLFQIIRLFTRSNRLACFGAALWGIAPLHQGPVGWYSVYGHVLVGTILLWLTFAVSRVGEGKPLTRGTLVRWSLLLAAAATSFGVGIGLALVFPLAAFLLLSPSPERTTIVRRFTVVGGAIALLYVVYTWTYVAVFGGFSETPYLMRSIVNWGPTLRLLLNLIGSGVAAIVLGTLAEQARYPGTVAYLVIGCYAVLLLATLAAGPSSLRRRLLACLVLSAGCYGMIAIGRAMFMTSATLPRYHYAGTLPLVLALCLGLSRVPVARLPPLMRTALLLAWIAGALIGRARFGSSIDHRDKARAGTTEAIAEMRRLIESAPPGHDVYIPNRPLLATGFWPPRQMTAFPGWAGLFTIFFPENVVDGRRVYFVVSDPSLVEALKHDKRVGTLLVMNDNIDARVGPRSAEPSPTPAPSDLDRPSF